MKKAIFCFLFCFCLLFQSLSSAFISVFLGVSSCASSLAHVHLHQHAICLFLCLFPSALLICLLWIMCACTVTSPGNTYFWPGKRERETQFSSYSASIKKKLHIVCVSSKDGLPPAPELAMSEWNIYARYEWGNPQMYNSGRQHSWQLRAWASALGSYSVKSQLCHLLTMGSTKLFNLSNLLYPPLQNGGNKSIHLTGLLWGCKKIIHESMNTVLFI